VSLHAGISQRDVTWRLRGPEPFLDEPGLVLPPASLQRRVKPRSAQPFSGLRFRSSEYTVSASSAQNNEVALRV
jgi:hypothetical protein